MSLNIKKIYSKFIEAQEKSIKIKRSVLFTITDSSNINPLTLIDFKKTVFNERVYWSQPDKNFHFLALGKTLDLNLKNISKSHINNKILDIIHNKIGYN